MKTKIFLMIALITTGLSVQAQQDEQMVEAVSPSKQAELPLLSNPKLVIGETALTFTDNTNSTEFSKNERLVIRMKKENDTDIPTNIVPVPYSKATTQEGIYSIDGMRQNNLKQGINVIRRSNGEVKKIIAR